RRKSAANACRSFTATERRHNKSRRPGITGPFLFGSRNQSSPGLGGAMLGTRVVARADRSDARDSRRFEAPPAASPRGREPSLQTEDRPVRPAARHEKQYR